MVVNWREIDADGNFVDVPVEERHAGEAGPFAFDPTADYTPINYEGTAPDLYNSYDTDPGADDETENIDPSTGLPRLQDGYHSTRNMLVDVDPKRPSNVVRFASLKGLITPVQVTNIDDPTTDLSVYNQAGQGNFLLVRSSVAGIDEYTLYVWDPTIGTGADSPYIVRGGTTGSPGTGGYWVAHSGKYQQSARNIKGDLGVTGTGTFSGALASTTLNTGQGANELYPMDQAVLTTSAPTFATVNTGQGANELYPMDQAVRQADSPTFATATLSGLTATRLVKTDSSKALSSQALGSALQVLRTNAGATDVEWATPTVGTVTSVGSTGPSSFFTWTNSPVTSSGTLTAALNTQSANLIFAGPATGSAAVPTFRSLVATDISNNLISNAMLRQGAGLSVIGVTGLSTANEADIVGTADQVLRVNSAGTALAFGTIQNAGLANSSITFTDGAGIGMSGSPVSLGGSLTLTSNTATPRFGSLGLNSAAPAAAGQFTTNFAPAGGSSVIGTSINMTTTLAAGSANLFRSLQATSSIAQAGFNATGTPSAVGLYGQARATGATGIVTQVDAANLSTANTGAGTLTTGAALHIVNGANTGGGTFSNNIGILIDSMTTGSTANYAIKQAGTGGLNVFAGNTRVGATTDPTVALDVTGQTILTPASGVALTANGAAAVAAINISQNGPRLDFTNTQSNAAARNFAIRSDSTAFGDLCIIQSNALNGNPVSAGTVRFSIGATGDVCIGSSIAGAKLDVRGSAIFNEDGSSVDWRAEGDTEQNLLFLQGSTDRIGIGTNTPASRLELVGTTGQAIFRGTTSTTFGGVSCYNDQNSTSRSMELRYTGSSFSGAGLTGGPTGEAGLIYTSGTGQPLVLGSSGVAKLSFGAISGAGQSTFYTGLVNPTNVVTGDVTIGLNDYFLGVNSAAAARTITLPSIASLANGWRTTVIDLGGAAASFNIVIQRGGSDAFNGTAATSMTINTNLGSKSFLIINGKWSVF